jgi:NAD(P)-dependent dehydrogenase (short-subunit alcohol dehydrogenase family)
MKKMAEFSGAVVVVTGATSGIGRALALQLGARGASLCLVGRDERRLDDTARVASESSPRVVVCALDLTAEGAIKRLSSAVGKELGGVDVLVHSAGVFEHGSARAASVEAFDRHWSINVRSVWALTQELLASLLERRGQVVFINSSVVARGQPFVGQYSATKHALKGVADCLREEVNSAGVRVLSVFPGRTATAGQERLMRAEGRDYRPERLLQPEDVASIVVHALAMPRTAEITEVYMRSMLKP